MFLIKCPNCGARNATDFRYGGEYNPRPRDASARDWADYVYARDNRLGEQLEWWYHRAGCQRWFVARRHTGTNEVVETRWANEASAEDRRLESIEQPADAT